MIKVLKYFLQSLIVYFFFFAARILGLKLSRIIFSSLFSLIGPIFRSNKILNRNLEIFNSYVPACNKKKIKKEMWSNYGKTFIEYAFLRQLHNNNSHISIKGQDNLDEAIKNKNPVIFVSGHFANFELMSMEITKRDIKLATIYRPLNNFFLNPFMEFVRKKYICKNQIKKGISGVRESIEYLKNNYSIALMIDQRLGEGEKINFFGQSALTTTLPAQLAIKFNLQIIPVFIERTDDNNFMIEFLKPLNNKKFDNKLQFSEELNKVLERMIIKNPYQWIWTHNRWK
tara:strand:+ start:5992 stop:6849 length:858 start_codon:yes stop_codon:yes gene_type:complete